MTENEYRICVKCILDTNIKDSELIFNNKGICNYCLAFEKNEQARKLNKTNLPWMIYSIKKMGKGKKYDCLMGLSGGVDSSLALHYAVEQGLRPLCFSMDNGYNTQLSDENIMNLVEGLKIPFYRYVIDIKKFKKLYRAFIIGGIKNLEAVYDHILFAATYEIAAREQIKFIITGGNLATEGIMPRSFGEDPRDLHWIKSVYKKVMDEKLTGLPMISLWKEQYYRLYKKIRFVPILDYYEYNWRQAKQLLKDKYGWIDYGAKHEENRLTLWFQNRYLPEKFGLDKRKPHFSSLINSEQLNREKALWEIRKPFKKIIIDEFEDFMNFPKKEYRNYPNSAYLREKVMKIYKFIPSQCK